ncbi:polysaccharide deacetylase family protein [Bacillus benzoevorans]|uniref:Putative sporulation protein (Polysaccharide deacetylase family) n=1 Tax=Bacillus benzoevorans TaxID=1456 RepID=A0A7X0LTY0_9BACI|nr:polysaccharide deacetylase family protein [Bacillus benzoevorans]MBB6443890.1 putative sporulation protein (polysaccharide deacetylase family) [Bacillus benzoevorans]
MKKIISLCVIFLIAFIMTNNRFTNEFITEMKGNTVEVAKKHDSLYMEIEQQAETYEIPPSDAKIDPVWKAIPGYNGQAVDIEASYEKMKKNGKFDERKLEFRQVKPRKHLADLPPAAIYKGNPDKPMVSLIINVAWGNEYLSDMLATLKRHHIHATFFLEGRWVKKNPELAKMITDAGHEAGNHSYTHPNMQNLTSAQIRQEMVKTNEVIEATTGERVRWMAPPSGSYKNEVVQIAAEEKLGTIMWSVDTIDWQRPTPDVLIDRVMSKIHNGAIILMHPTEPTAKSLEQLIGQIKAKGLQIGTISELVKEDRVTAAQAKVYNPEKPHQ